jgi:anaerobic selenocysteine-containing dehydrogenase
MPSGRARFSALTPPDLNAVITSPAQQDEGSASDSSNLLPATYNLQPFFLSTRRGKQFNSMLWSANDPTTGSSRRDDIFISHEDAHRLGLRDGDAVLLRAANISSSPSDPAHVAPAGTCPDTIGRPASVDSRSFRGVCKIAAVKSGTLQAFWPEANVLISSRLDPASHEPDYNAWVTLEKL